MPPKRKATEGPAPAGSAAKKADTAAGKAKTKAEKRAEYAAKAKELEEKMASPYGLEYVCLGRQGPDWTKEWEEDDDWAEEPSDEQLEKANGQLREVAGKPAEEFPDCKWIVTREAKVMADDYQDQTDRRDPDAFDMYIYNDYAGYGQQEVIENMLLAFKKEFAKKTCDPHRLWVRLEAMALYFYLGDQTRWQMIDDGERYIATLEGIGDALLTGLNVLERADLLKPDSKVKNIGFVLAMFLDFALTHNDGCSEQEWPAQAIAYAKGHKVPIDTLYDAEELVESLSDEDVTLESFEKRPAVDRWHFKTAMKDLAEYGTLGGHKFDIVKMPKSERIEASFDKVDPLDEADPDGMVH